MYTAPFSYSAALHLLSNQLQGCWLRECTRGLLQGCDGVSCVAESKLAIIYGVASLFLDLLVLLLLLVGTYMLIFSTYLVVCLSKFV